MERIDRSTRLLIKRPMVVLNQLRKQLQSSRGIKGIELYSEQRHTMSEIIIRSATASDKTDVAKMIVCGFRDDFSKLSKNLDNVVRTLENGIDIERFFIAKDGDETVGVIACTDCNGRAVMWRLWC